MSELKVFARMKIHDGKLEEFRELARQCMRSVRENDCGTLQYDWYFTPGSRECLVVERYADSDAVIDHMSNLGETMAMFFSVCDVSIQVIGDPSEELMTYSEDVDVEVLEHFQSIDEE